MCSQWWEREKGITVHVALISGGSRGLGRALASDLADRGWGLVLTARGEQALDQVAKDLGRRTKVAALAGDVTDPVHRRDLIAATQRLGGLDLLVNNASELGPSPQPTLADYPLVALERVYAANVVAPLALVQLALPLLRPGEGRILNVTSDAAVEGYPGWGGYGSSKAALEQLSNVLAAEHPDLRVWWVDPGDMRTQMHQEAFPGEDISDRPRPEDVAPLLAGLVESDRPSGRYRAADLEAVR
jgi:NAD(P)-dependent dehydrogenase (short-subunit alcohol dehydrogenase family)